MTLKSICFALVASIVRCCGEDLQKEVLVQLDNQGSKAFMTLLGSSKVIAKFIPPNSLFLKGPEASECGHAVIAVNGMKIIKEFSPELVEPMLGLIRSISKSSKDDATLTSVLEVLDGIMGIARSKNPKFHFSLNSLLLDFERDI